MKHAPKQFLGLIFGLLTIVAYSQNSTGKKMMTLEKKLASDTLDSNGNKHGLWLEKNGMVEVYYKDNQRDGVYKAYSAKKRTLRVFGEYALGKAVGKWFYFNDSGVLLFTEESIREINDSTRFGGLEKKPVSKFSAYIKMYYANGTIKSEGSVQYFDDVEVDFTKTGIWKYYDTNGKLLEEKIES